MASRTDRTLDVVIVVLIGVLGALCAWQAWRPRAPSPAAPSPTEGRAALIYRQRDPRWRDARIGGSGETLGQVGCTVCCIAMALEHHGIPMTPAQLNARLKGADGYTPRGWVKWRAVAQVTGGALRVQVIDQPSERHIDAALDAGCPVIAKVYLGGVAQHWVLVVAKSGDDYLVKDPLGDGTSLARLSGFRSGVKAIRIVRR